jgi:3-dehydroquinate dehydratase
LGVGGQREREKEGRRTLHTIVQKLEEAARARGDVQVGLEVGLRRKDEEEE